DPVHPGAQLHGADRGVDFTDGRTPNLDVLTLQAPNISTVCLKQLRHLLLLHADNLWTGQGECRMETDETLDPVVELRVLGLNPATALQKGGADSQQQFAQQVLLSSEVPVDRLPGDADFTTNVIQGHRGKATGAE